MWFGTMRGYKREIEKLLELVNRQQEEIEQKKKELKAFIEPEINKGIERVVDGKLYSTNNSEFVITASVPFKFVEDLQNVFIFTIGELHEVDLYKGKFEWFIVYGKTIKPVTVEEAKKILSDNVSLYKKYFGSVEMA